MKSSIKLYFISIIVILSTTSSVVSQAQSRDSLLSAEIKYQLNDVQKLGLSYTNTVKRFYEKNKFNIAWVRPQSGEGTAWQAMLLIDCVLQFGLSHNDYHPKEISYGKLHNILDTPNKKNISAQARFEIILTDGIITFINHLHYGKLNPYFTAMQIDGGNANSFNSEQVLINALKEKDFMNAIAAVQPKSKEYHDLQYHMQLLTGLYQGDCYEIPEADIRKIAINMERLRWANIDGNNYIHINIPSYSLMFHQPDTTYRFKVIVGKPGNPTPALSSEIKYFTTAPEWNVPANIFRKEVLPKALKDENYLENNHLAIYDNKGKYVPVDLARLKYIQQNINKYSARQSSGCDNALGQIVFRFPNVYDVYLHDTPEQQLFNKTDRAFSHGCIRVENAGKLAELLLIKDNASQKVKPVQQAMAAYKKQSFTLNKPMPIKITYLTCAVNEGVLVKYKDVYDLDNRLEMALYNVK